MTRDVMTVQLYDEGYTLGGITRPPAPSTVASRAWAFTKGSTLLCLVGIIGWLLWRG